MQEENQSDKDLFEWTVRKAVWAIFLFVLAGFAEIAGGWMVWAALRGNAYTNNINDNVNVDDVTTSTTSYKKKPWWFAIVGSCILILYGFIPCLQPMDSFGRIYAVYGGFFIVLSFLFGWVLDGDRPDIGDIVGGTIAIVGVFVIMLWPRVE